MIVVLTAEDLKRNSTPTDIDKISLCEDFVVRDKSAIESASIVVYVSVSDGKFKLLKNRCDEYETIRLLRVCFGKSSIFQYF